MEVLSFAGLLSIMVNIPILKTLLYAGIKASFILFPFLIILCSFYYLFEMIYIGIYKGHWKKLELKLGKIQSEHQVSGSIINENIHDILVLFHNADLDVVVFEDIDRLSNAMDIFTKLRELNETINRSHEIKNEGKKVMFMYALNDNIIPESEERTKFFDLIMPLYPIISHINKVDMVYNELNKFNIELKESLSSKFISKIAPFIEDIRLLKNICNEYAIYQKLFFLNTSIENHIGKVELSEKIFTLITLKIFFPEHFYNRNKKDGLLQSIFVETKNKLKEGATKVLKDLSSDNDFQHLNSEEAFISMDDIKGSMTLHELIKNGYYNHERLSKYIPNNKITTTKLKDFIITIIKNGYLDEFYDLYLSNKTSELTKNDQLFVQLQNTNYDIPIDYRLDSPIDVMEFINKNKVSNPLNLLNYSLLSYDDNNKDYYTINPLTIIYEFIHSYESLRYKFNVTTQVLQIGFNRQKLQTR
ncbi:YobI family P-loop NTPase [Halosquirtibacter xylanolyticus]|uniref:YobI family P-loop NTPase n=1 Tax=Halosquirtibacter xylanolyticus TaxID=3374599 RepID=UPI00374A1FF3